MLSTDCELEVALERTDGVFQAGDLVRGFVGVRVGKPVKVRELQVKLGWRTHGRGTVNRGEADAAVLFQGDWAEGAADLYPFELRIPAGPLTFHNENLNLDWYVTASADVPWALDPSAEREIEVRRPNALQRLDLGPLPPHRETVTGAMSTAVGVVFGLFFFGFSLIFHVVMFPTALIALGRGELGTAIMMLLFELIPLVFTVIGAAIVVGSVRGWDARRRLGSPRLEAPEQAAPGEQITVRVAFTPAANLHLQTVRLRLVGEAVTESGSGTNTRSWRDAFFTEAVPFGMRGELAAGVPVVWEATVTVPPDAAPTFTATQNRVSWFTDLELQERGRTAVSVRQTITVDR